ncbi:MAG: protein kinase [Planctomycetota bacterium]
MSGRAPESSSRAQAIVARALELDVDEGAAFVDAECGDDVDLKNEVLGLMDSAAQALFEDVGGHLTAEAKPAVAVVPARDGQTIGSFRVVRAIGSGGMGVVYEAEQDFPSRRVALKVLPPSLGQAGAEMRFRSEIQFLARLDHPGVARMLEAGVHVGDGGVEQPFFAMEFVPDAQDLISWGNERSLRERLELFGRVCDAVQHGHQQGVVHRDLKPANVLVSGVDNLPKVIDFGVAGALEDEAEVARTRATQAGDVVGTLQYMAPEQLEGSLSVDTRTDIHALGLLLYELVTGEAPYALAGRSLSEIVKVIREEAPARVDRADAAVPGDLRWVILKATAKEPDRRYASASGLADDLQRFLDHRPVEAVRPSRTYAFRMFVRRNKLASAAAAAVLASIVAGTVISVVSLVKASREAENFRSMNAVLTGMFQDVRTDAGGASIPAVQLLDRAAERVASFSDRPGLEADLRLTLLQSYASLGYPDATIREAERALELRDELSVAEELEAAGILAEACLESERLDDTREVLRRYDREWFADHPEAGEGDRVKLGRVSAALALREGQVDEAIASLKGLRAALLEAEPDRLRLLETVDSTLNAALLRAGRLAEGEGLARDRVGRLEGLAGVHPDLILQARAMLARTLVAQSRYSDARSILEGLVQPVVKAYGDRHTFTLEVLTYLATVYTDTGSEQRAVAILEDVVAARMERFGPEHPDVLLAQSGLAQARVKVGDERGEELLREGLAIRTTVYGRRDRRTLQAMSQLSGFLRRARRLDEAEPLQVELHELSQEVFVDADLERHKAAAELGLLRLIQGRPEEATALMEPAWRGYLRRAEPGDPETLVVGNNLAGSLAEAGRVGEAVDVFIEVLAELRAAHDPESETVWKALVNLSAAYEHNGELNLALQRRRDALEWCLEYRDEGDPMRLKTQEGVGHLLVQMERTDEALILYRELMRGTQLNPKLGPVERNRFRLGYARCLVAAGSYAEGVEAFETVIEAERARLGDVDPDWITGLEAELAEAERLQETASSGEVD